MNAAATTAPDLPTKKSASQNSEAMWRKQSMWAAPHRPLCPPEGWHLPSIMRGSVLKEFGVEAAETRKSIAQEGR
jgi:hypothetical protein